MKMPRRIKDTTIYRITVGQESDMATMADGRFTINVWKGSEKDYLNNMRNEDRFNRPNMRKMWDLYCMNVRAWRKRDSHKEFVDLYGQTALENMMLLEAVHDADKAQQDMTGVGYIRKWSTGWTFYVFTEREEEQT